MKDFLLIIVILIALIIFCTLSFERAMWLCIDYWSDKQYRLWKLICAAIGVCYLVAIVLICVFSSDRFSTQMMKQSVILVAAAYISMGIFMDIIHIIAWKKRRDILEEKIRLFLNDKDFKSDKEKLLDICLFENQDYTKRTVRKVFDKVYSEFKQNIK